MCLADLSRSFPLSLFLSFSLLLLAKGATDTKSEGIPGPECTGTIVLFSVMTDIHVRVYINPTNLIRAPLEEG